MAHPRVTAFLLRSSDGGRAWVNGAPKLVEDQGPLLVFGAGQRLDLRTRTALWQLDGGVWRSIGA